MSPAGAVTATAVGRRRSIGAFEVSVEDLETTRRQLSEGLACVRRGSVTAEEPREQRARQREIDEAEVPNGLQVNVKRSGRARSLEQRDCIERTKGPKDGDAHVRRDLAVLTRRSEGQTYQRQFDRSKDEECEPPHRGILNDGHREATPG